MMNIQFLFSDKINSIMEEAGMVPVSSSYIHRSTVNVREGIDVPRIFAQGKYKLKEHTWKSKTESSTFPTKEEILDGTVINKLSLQTEPDSFNSMMDEAND